MAYHMGPAVAVFLWLSSVGIPATALHTAPESSSTKKSDCFSPYDGKPLLQISECTAGLHAETLSLMANKTCLCLGDWGELLMPTHDCCTSAPVLCDSDAAFRLKDRFSDQVDIIDKDAGSYYRAASGNAEEYREVPNGTAFSRGRSEFYAKWRTLDSQQERIRNVVEECGVARIERIGTSHENRSIDAVRFTGHGYRPGGLKVLGTYQVHAREWISGMSAVYAVEQIARHIRRDAGWLGDAEILIVPMVNPDGFIYSGQTDRLWRKNMRSNGKYDCSGVDLNRNFQKDWNGRGSTSRDTCSEVYVGPGAGSEPETQAVMGVVNEAWLPLHLDFHSYSELILLPWSYKMKPHKDRRQLERITEAMRQAIQANSGKRFTVGGNEILYPASGVAPDYSTDKGGWGLTIELSPGTGFWEGGFLLPEREIATTVRDAWAAFEAAFDWLKANNGPRVPRRVRRLRRTARGA